MATSLKDFHDLPQTQQKVLAVILRLNKKVFTSSEVTQKLSVRTGGKSGGALLGALYRNGYLEKVAGGRDKVWKLADEAEKVRDDIKAQIFEFKVYWS